MDFNFDDWIFWVKNENIECKKRFVKMKFNFVYLVKFNVIIIIHHINTLMIKQISRLFRYAHCPNNYVHSSIATQKINQID